VVDLVDSTRLATHYGDGLAMRARTVLKDRTSLKGFGGLHRVYETVWEMRQ